MLLELTNYSKKVCLVSLEQWPSFLCIFLILTVYVLLLGSSADFSEMLLPLLAVLQDLVDSNVLAPSLQLVSLYPIAPRPGLRYLCQY